MSDRVVHFEVPADDVERARTFYATVFGWNVVPVPGMDYTMASTGPAGETGMPSEPGFINGGIFQRDTVVSTPVITILVGDIEVAAAAITAEGGFMVRDKHAVGDMGWAAYFKDSEGNLLGLWQTAT